MSNTVKKEVISWIKTILLAVVLTGLVNTILIVNAQVPTESMQTTIMAGDRVWLFVPPIGLASRKEGDVVVFRYRRSRTENLVCGNVSSVWAAIVKVKMAVCM